MPYKVLVVDDSNFFQHRLTAIINEHPELEVVGVAANGREAVEKAESLRPDIISMDYEMPVLNGVSAVKEIMAKRPVPILMFSSMTYEGARITLDALAAGAVDFITKDFAEVSRSTAQLKSKLHQRLLDIIKNQRITRSAPAISPTTSFTSGAATFSGGQSSASQSSTAALRSSSSSVAEKSAQSVVKPAETSARNFSHLSGRVGLLVIGASTGGPVALTEVLTKLPANFSLPIMLIQHMPENFTKAFAERLNKQCKIEVKEAADGDRLRPGLALLAPGGKQLILDQQNRGAIKILPGDDRMNYRPSVDITFASAANVYGNKTLGIVLTGMGSDGCDGARLLKQKGACVWSQDEASCVIYGMPMVVAKANLSDAVLGLNEFGPKLAQLFS